MNSLGLKVIAMARAVHRDIEVVEDWKKVRNRHSRGTLLGIHAHMLIYGVIQSASV